MSQFAAIPVPLSEEDGYHIHPDKIAEEIARGTGVIITSNPRNPTGRVVQNPELAEIQDICRERAVCQTETQIPNPTRSRLKSRPS
jgi:aspartate/methionine/tyrosine aminotransferase